MANSSRCYNPIDRIDWFEVFLRVDPDYIFNCILVSKEWLRVITRPEFRPSYEKRWNRKSKVVGFLKHGYQRTEESTACSMISKLLQNPLCLECKSSSSGHILSRVNSTSGILYVSRRIAAPDGLITELPPPYPESYSYFGSTILSENPNHFKVILAKTCRSWEDTMYIQTFSSSTRKWEQFQTSESNWNLDYLDRLVQTQPGIVSSKGVVYWRMEEGKMIACDINNKSLRCISRPNWSQFGREYHHKGMMGSVSPKGEGFVFRTFVCYGVSPRGSLCCATYARFTKNLTEAWDMATIKLWVLDDDKTDWILVKVVQVQSMWAENSAMLEPLYGGKRPETLPFTFVSFVPETTDYCFYVELEGVYFEYNPRTQELDRKCGSYVCSYSKAYYLDPCEFDVPLTVSDLGVWPVYPKTIPED